MKLILLFIIGIAFLIILPTAYFCFSKLLDKKSSNKSAVRAAVLFFIIFMATVVAAGNMYTYFLNSEEGIVAERYVNQLLKQAENGDIETLISNTQMISHDIEDLDKVFATVQSLEFSKTQGMMISEDRRTDDDIEYLMIWLNETDIAFDIGLLQQKNFWDVYSIEVIDGEQLDKVLAAERFLPIK